MITDTKERHSTAGHSLLVLGGLLLAATVFGGGVAFFGPAFASWFKSALGIVLAAVFLSFGLLTLQRLTKEGGLSLGLSLRAVAVSAIFLVVLTRGAPHNNPLLSVTFETFGVGALVGLTMATAFLGVGAAWLVLRNAGSVDLDACCQRYFVPSLAILGLCAVAGAAQPILAAWDQPSWSDALSYERIAHGVALGELPAGRSDYMPVFQFGSGALYWSFGHFFFVQQLANLALAPVTVVLLGLAAAWMFGSAPAGLVASLLAASHDYLRYTPNMLTIENWYLPAIALALYFSARFLASPSLGRIVLVALAAGLIFGIRVQGAFFCAFLLLVPLFAAGLPVGTKLRYTLVAGFVFIAALTPWTVRNFVLDGRVSPGTTQAGGQMVFTTDRRPFYGIRREFGTAEIAREWIERYPDAAERHAAMAREGWLRPLTDPKLVWLEAVPWRTLAFYGLLPPGVWDVAGVRPTDWKTEGLKYALQIGPVAMLLLASLVGLLLARPFRVALFLIGGIGANLFVIVFAGFSEPRLSYPVFPLHMILAAAPFLALAPSRRMADWLGRPGFRTGWFGRRAAIAIVLAVVVTLLARAQWGERYALRPLMADIETAGDVRIDSTVPDITCALPPILDGRITDGFRRSDRIVRLRAVLTNYHLPVKYYGLASDDPGTALRGYPEFASDSQTETYFEAKVDKVGCDEQANAGLAVLLGVSLAGASSTEILIERDLVEIQGVLKAEKDDRRLHWMWIDGKQVRLIKRGVQLRQ